MSACFYYDLTFYFCYNHHHHHHQLTVIEGVVMKYYYETFLQYYYNVCNVTKLLSSSNENFAIFLELLNFT